MPAAAAQEPAPIDVTLRGLHGLVNATRRRLRWSWLGAGTGLALGLSVTALLIAAGFDIALGLPDFARWLAFAAFVALAALLVGQRVLRPLLQRLTPTGTALQIERVVPNMHNRLVTALDLSRTERPPESEPFFRLIVRQAQERLAGFRSGQIVDGGSLRRAAIWAVAPTLALIGGWFAAPRFVRPGRQNSRASTPSRRRRATSSGPETTSAHTVLIPTLNSFGPPNPPPRFPFFGPFLRPL